jgi:hypothetical protein
MSANKTFDLIWSPEGRCIATVDAANIARAKRMAPKPYRKFLGEIYVLEVLRLDPCTVEPMCKRHAGGCTK